MAYRRKQRRNPSKRNPSGGGMESILLLGGAGVMLYLAYQNNLGGIQSLLHFGASTPTPAPSIGTNNPITNPNTTVVNTPTPPPPLGTVVTNGNDVTAQATAGYAYILPAAGLNTSTPPNGYSVMNTIDYGPVFLRNNVYGAASTVINARVQRAIDQGAAETSIQNAGRESLQDIQTVMSSNGLTGGWGY